MNKIIMGVVLLLFLVGCSNNVVDNSGFSEANSALNTWMKYQDSETGFFPQYTKATLKLFLREFLRKNSDLWTIENSAADLYPFLVLSAEYT